MEGQTGHKRSCETVSEEKLSKRKCGDWHEGHEATSDVFKSNDGDNSEAEDLSDKHNDGDNSEDLSDSQLEKLKTTSQVQLNINDLPQSMLLKIVGKLSLQDLLCRVSLVCKYWYDLAHDPALWRRVDLKVKVAGQSKVTDDVLRRMTRLSDNVSHIDITDNTLVTSQAVVDMTQQCPHLQELKLCRCSQLESDAFSAIAEHCSKLRWLNLDCCFSLTDKDLTRISSGCRNLSRLRLLQCKVSDVGLKAVATNCARLRTLCLDQCSQVTGESLKALANGCRDLEELSCMGCDLKYDGLLCLTTLKKLRLLALSQVKGVNDAVVIDIARHCKQIETFNLNLCESVSDKSVEYLAKHNHNLRCLYLVNCKVTDKTLMSLADHCKNLTILDVGWCADITEEGALKISESCHSLRSLGLMRCDKVSPLTAEHLEDKYPHIKFSTFYLDCKRLVERAHREGFIRELPPLQLPATSAPRHLMANQPQ